MRTWKVDSAHSEIHFTVRHMVVAKVRGVFTRWDADLQVDEADLTRSNVEVKIDASSIDTRQPQRDGHLRSPDFFDVEKFPELRFVSKRVMPAGEGEWKVVGDLTI